MIRLRYFGIGLAIGSYGLSPLIDMKYVVSSLLAACFCCLFDIAERDGK